MITNDYELTLERAIFGSKLHLKINKKNKSFKRWYVSDKYNGTLEETDINKPLYGFWKPESVIDINLIDSKNKTIIIKNVKIKEKEGTVNV